MASEPILGTIFAFAGNFAPRGYALCQGQLLAISTNTALFSLLGTTYGGDGIRTFALPNLSGRAPVGAGQGPGLNPLQLGEVSGTQSVSLTSANIPPHSHALRASSAGSNSDTPAGNSLAATADAATGASLPSYSGTAPTATLNYGSIAPNGGGGIPISTQSPILGINYIIATAGIFPSRN